MWPIIPKILTLWFFTESVVTSAQRRGACFSGVHLLDLQISKEALSEVVPPWLGSGGNFSIPVLHGLWFLHSSPPRPPHPRDSLIGCVEFRLVHTQLSPQLGTTGDLPCRSWGPNRCAVCPVREPDPHIPATLAAVNSYRSLRSTETSALRSPYLSAPRAADRTAGNTAPIHASPFSHSSALPVVCAGRQLPRVFCLVSEFFRMGWQVNSTYSDWVWSESPFINPYFSCRHMRDEDLDLKEAKSWD